ncbi:PstS family phosphate ABC transporter substrate-binding protein [Oscillatoria salina]|uniref:PstS family phosphate ABC transporter substrate-binding protein n=1 Tax=Oscillatoria salina TaxID=331517 RepID=UPI0013B7776E|nr:PstS family phosphate ABC transporter substrate-binding protein [Oscillatoria salina]MBZ8180074.1 PstS family phosphate ABC transporter substrate-binding protein [Oscillatoria salina IIICB1]NET90550.1 PstS family phosphate ABC transporter substrate-binding protein [Kamptonema sp. SIO1D9]
MSQKNETLTLILTLAITVALLGGGFWLFNRGGFNLSQDNSQDNNQTANNSQIEAATTASVDTFAEVENVPSGLFSYGGSTTWATIRKEVDPAIQTVWPKFDLRYTDPTSGAPGSGTGIKMLLNNQLAFSQSSRSLKEEEYEKAQTRSFSLKEIPVAIDGIAIATHPDLTIPGITISQLQDIYTGKITNWNQIGGNSIPIIAYSRPVEAGGTSEFFVENVLNGAEFAANIELVSTTTEALRKVAENPGGIYFASAPEVVPQCTIKTLPIGRRSDEFVAPYQKPFVPLDECPNRRNQLNSAAFQNGEYPITRRLFVIVKQDGSVDEQAGITYANLLLSNQGQQLIEEAGFVRIR